jgi:hypothetical protein
VSVSVAGCGDPVRRGRAVTCWLVRRTCAACPARARVEARITPAAHGAIDLAASAVTITRQSTIVVATRCPYSGRVSGG